MFPWLRGYSPYKSKSSKPKKQAIDFELVDFKEPEKNSGSEKTGVVVRANRQTGK
ncbi:TPA: hypothetical protein ACMD15_003398 [Vibrio cholerae]